RRICMPANDDDRMPPKGDLLKAEEIALIKQWIDSAPAVAAPEIAPITRAQIIEAIHADLEKLRLEERANIRYLSLHNLRNAGDGEEALKVYRAAVSKTV